MVAVLLTIHSLVVIALIGVVLLQRSEGGAVLSGGSFMTGRGAANALTRTTSALAAVFFATSLTLAIIAARGEKARSVVEELTGVGATSGPAKSTDDLLRSLGSEPDAPARTAPEPRTPQPGPEPSPDAAPEAAFEPAPGAPPAEGASDEPPGR